MGVCALLLAEQHSICLYGFLPVFVIFTPVFWLFFRELTFTFEEFC